MAWLVPGMVTMAARVTVLLVVPLAPATMVALVTALLVMVSLAPALATMVARVTDLLAMVSLAPALALPLLPLALPALVLAGTRARRLELKTRQLHEASGLVRERQQQQQLPRLQAAAAAAEA